MLLGPCCTFVYTGQFSILKKILLKIKKKPITLPEVARLLFSLWEHQRRGESNRIEWKTNDGSQCDLPSYPAGTVQLQSPRRVDELVGATVREVPKTLRPRREGRGGASQYLDLRYGGRCRRILRSSRLSAADSEKYDTVNAKFDAHFVKRRNMIYVRAKFNLRRQRDGETSRMLYCIYTSPNPTLTLTTP